MESIIEVDGGNNYKLKHKQKDKLERAGLLPVSFGCESGIAQAVCAKYREDIAFLRYQENSYQIQASINRQLHDLESRLGTDLHF